ncbi:MAG TPA: hypothetical protein DIW23_15235, partial [Anaerolineae bacterium]|nr:hypothetical protein [Anaerolineae bacterium]
GFVLISALIGTAVGSLARGFEYSFDFPSIIVLLICWLAYCFIFHIICKLLGGKGTFVETLSVGLQVLSVIYVISNFAEYLWRVLLAYPSLGNWVINLNEIYFGNQQFISNPTIVYFVIQFVLLTIYLPLAGINLHDFNKNKKFWVVMLFILVIVVNVTLFVYIFRTLVYISERLSFY